MHGATEKIKIHITANFFLLFGVTVKTFCVKGNRENANLNLKVMATYNTNITGDELYYMNLFSG
jgi:hypothetical protein